MAWETQLLRLLQGPLAGLALIVFTAGLLGQTIRLWLLTEKVDPARVRVSPDPRHKDKADRRLGLVRYLARLRTTALGNSAVLVPVSLIFHVCLVVVPLFIKGHNVLLRVSFGLALPSFSDGLADLLTMVVLGCGLFFLARRLLVKKVRVITGAGNVLLLLLVLLVFLTGLLARHQLVLDYNLMMILHMAGGVLLLIIIPFSKFFHMIFFFFGRFLIVNEYGFGRSRRTWRF